MLNTPILHFPGPPFFLFLCSNISLRPDYRLFIGLYWTTYLVPRR